MINVIPDWRSATNTIANNILVFNIFQQPEESQTKQNISITTTNINTFFSPFPITLSPLSNTHHFNNHPIRTFHFDRYTYI